MKILFPNCSSRAGISIRTVINALLKSRNAERVQTAHRKKNVRQITSQWNYRPRQVIRRHPAIHTVKAKTSAVVIPKRPTTNQENDTWFNFVSRDPKLENLKTKAQSPGPESRALNDNLRDTGDSYISP